ncbi:dienelactone hydrolase family protein [Sediminitomix flava]|uniref:Carboxymethylenebutenolidase n=1 Tax=Sediminitomix flava TaxID=379075 RepID=A0A315Z5F1_SEDFL|nr:dienelactone hydrolase family protein [Sediminitomix flava]PWJ38497.1 carboxymethylenebutenolidase [Sediminitomix flava]
MKKLSLLILGLCSSLLITAFVLKPTDNGYITPSNVGVYCHGNYEAIDNFATLTEDKDFRMAHELPRAITTEGTGEMITYTVKGGGEANAYLIKSAQASDKYLFVIHEWWGLNDHIKAEAETLAKALKDVNVIALDIYDGKVATTREDAGKYMRSVSKERGQAIVEGAIKYAGKKAEIATIGWCFGGGWSLQSALLAKKQTVGCVIYYGMPETDASKLKGLNSDVLGIFAAKDKWITPEVVGKFEESMKSLDKGCQIEMYEDADHAFANPSSPRYVEKDAQDANAKAVAYLKERFDS